MAKITRTACFAIAHHDLCVRAAMEADQKSCLLANQLVKAGTRCLEFRDAGRKTPMHLVRYIDKITTQLIAHAIDVAATLRFAA